MSGIANSTKMIVGGVALFTLVVAGLILLSSPKSSHVAAVDDASANTLPALFSSAEPTSFFELIAQQETVILDVRTPEEYEEERIEGAQNIDFYAQDFATTIAALDRDAPYAVYCRSGNRSGQTLALMKEMGFTNVTHLEGGILAWNARGYSVCQRC